MSSSMSTFSIKDRDDDFSVEVTEVSGATVFSLRGKEGVPLRYEKE